MTEGRRGRRRGGRKKEKREEERGYTGGRGIWKRHGSHSFSGKTLLSNANIGPFLIRSVLPPRS